MRCTCFFHVVEPAFEDFKPLISLVGRRRHAILVQWLSGNRSSVAIPFTARQAENRVCSGPECRGPFNSFGNKIGIKLCISSRTRCWKCPISHNLPCEKSKVVYPNSEPTIIAVSIETPWNPVFYRGALADLKRSRRGSLHMSDTSVHLPTGVARNP